MKGQVMNNNFMSSGATRVQAASMKAHRQQTWKEDMMNRAAKIVYNDSSKLQSQEDINYVYRQN
jgi:hypothetical protein